MNSGMGFSTECESEKMGKMTMEEKFNAEGLQIVRNSTLGTKPFLKTLPTNSGKKAFLD